MSLPGRRPESPRRRTGARRRLPGPAGALPTCRLPLTAWHGEAGEGSHDQPGDSEHLRDASESDPSPADSDVPIT